MKNPNQPNLVAVALFGAVAFTTASLVAQDITNAVETAKPEESLERPPYRAWTIGLGIGTDAIFGGGVSWRFSDHFGVRGGFGYTESNWDDVGIRGLRYDVKLRLMCEPLTLDIYPWQKHSFHISVGMMFNQSELSGAVSSDGTITVDGQPVAIPKGSLSASIKPQPVNAYVSIGGNLLYFDRGHHWALAGELGVSYTGDSRVSVNRSGTSNLPDDVLNTVKQRLQNYGDQFQWWPVVKLAVSYSF